MPITIPVAVDVWLTHDFDSLPGVAGAALTVPGPVSVSLTGTNPAGQSIFVPTVAANRTGYVGFQYLPQSNIGGAVAALRNTIITGFAGVEPGKQVFVADNGTLTHTPPTAQAGEVVRPIGVGFTATRIYFY